MKKVFVTIILVFFCYSVNAQSNFKNGYVVTVKGDTIHGSLKWQNDDQSSSRCIFRYESGQTKIYKPDDIAGYRFENGKYYVSRFVEQKNKIHRVFAEYLVKGKKSLYYFRDAVGFHYLLSYKKDTLIEIPFRERNIYINGKGLYAGPPLQTGFLKLYFKDEPSLNRDIDNIQQLNFNNLISLTKKYNQLVCGNNCYTVYYTVPSIKPAFELQSGVEHLRGLTEHSLLPLLGGLVYLRLPRANKRLAVKTGFLYSIYPGNPNNPNEAEFYIYTIPLQFEYSLISGHKVIPKFDFGVDYLMQHFPGYAGNNKVLTLAGGAGAFLKASKSVYFDVSLCSDILAIRYNTSFFFTYTLSGGVYFKF